MDAEDVQNLYLYWLYIFGDINNNNNHNMPKIIQKEHELITADVKKTSMSLFNDKRYITRSGGDSFTSYFLHN